MPRYPLRQGGSGFSYADAHVLPPIPNLEEQTRAVRASMSDTLAAKRCLEIFALRIRHELSPEDELADRIASALEAAAEAPASKAAKVLTDALGLTAQRKRPRGDQLTVYLRIDTLMNEGKSETRAIAIASREFDIDLSTARRYLHCVRRGLPTAPKSQRSGE